MLEHAPKFWSAAIRLVAILVAFVVFKFVLTADGDGAVDSSATDVAHSSFFVSLFLLWGLVDGSSGCDGGFRLHTRFNPVSFSIWLIVFSIVHAGMFRLHAMATQEKGWGDVSAVLPADCPRTPPDNSVDLVLDVIAVLAKFSNNFCAVLKSRADLEPHSPDQLINISDVLQALNAFSGLPYPDPAPFGCP